MDQKISEGSGKKTNNKTYFEMSRGVIEQIKLINSCNDGGEFGEEKKLDKRNLGISKKRERGVN